jgi:hypothetical protein
VHDAAVILHACCDLTCSASALSCDLLRLSLFSGVPINKRVPLLSAKCEALTAKVLSLIGFLELRTGYTDLVGPVQA